MQLVRHFQADARPSSHNMRTGRTGRGKIHEDTGGRACVCIPVPVHTLESVCVQGVNLNAPQDSTF